jgi:ribokinase
MKIAVFGSVNLDIVATVARLPLAGETVSGTTLVHYPGGKGANQALAARRLGADVMMVACVGDDPAADQALALLRADGVDLSACRAVQDAPTGVALIGVAESGENQIIVVPGANGHLSSADGAGLKTDALIVQLETPVDAVVATVLGFHGLVVANLAPSIPVPEALIARADVIVVNESEAAFYGPLIGRCRGMIALTLGADGAKLMRNGAVIAQASPPPVTVVDTTGAGDTFVGALTVALLEGKDYESALTFACTAAALATTKAGAQPSFPTHADVEALYGG